jgi:hypothetical protein
VNRNQSLLLAPAILAALIIISLINLCFAQTVVDYCSFTLKEPVGNWQASAFDDSRWEKGQGGFGVNGTPGSRVNTPWSTKNIWFRKKYNLKIMLKKPVLLLHHDEDIEVYINGTEVLAISGFIKDYKVFPLDEHHQTLLKNGGNLIAVHCRQSSGGQFVDVHLVDGDVVSKSRPAEFFESETFYADKPQVVSQEMLDFVEAAAGRRPTPVERRSADRLWRMIEASDELLADWLWQDFGRIDIPSVFLEKEINALFDAAIAKAIADTATLVGGRWEKAKLPENCDHNAKLNFYKMVCVERRKARLARVEAELPEIVYARHFVLGGSHYAYTEALSDAQAERQFRAGGKLCRAEFSDGLWTEEVLLDSPEGIIRDVDVDYDANNILFAWKKSDREDDFSLYEMDVKSRKIRQLTSGEGIADYEGCYLPDGNILFNSTRCMQIVDCWWTEVSNIYRCDKDGKDIFRMVFDQVHDNYPTVTADGRVLYTRWEYNDRSQMFPQPLFQMAPDGTMQSAVYGENSWFPTTIIHARGIPDSQKIMAVATGHHTRQPGALIIIDPAKGRQENSGVQLIAPVRETKADRIDQYGQHRDLFAYPYPLDEESLLVMYNPAGWGQRKASKGREARGGQDRTTGFGIYWMDINGNREILVARLGLACGRPVPLRPRKRPAERPSMVDYNSKKGTFYVQDVYVGEPMTGVKRGTVKILRVIQIEYRPSGVGNNGNSGAGGGALVSTPVAIGNGAWDPKVLIGDAEVYEDGSVFFKTRCRKPLYFMLLDEKGRMVQSMRSWTTLQPGENASCVGCHESKNSVPSASARPTMAMAAGVQDLSKINGPVRGLSYLKEIQPILDKHCIKCHDGKDDKKPDLTATEVKDANAKRVWTKSYLALTHSSPDDQKRTSKWRGNANHKTVNWISAGSTVKLLPPVSKGSNTSALFAERLDKGHCKTISEQEVKTLAMWVDLGVPFCEDYLEADLWSDQDKEKFECGMKKRRRADKEDQETLKRLAITNP